jgi:hypothetical protein
LPATLAVNYSTPGRGVKPLEKLFQAGIFVGCPYREDRHGSEE